MTKKIYFDMDGTIADLYNVPEFEKYFINEKPIFEELKPLVNIEELKQTIKQLKAYGWEVGTITWLPKDTTKEYNKKAETEKRNWLKKYLPELLQDFTALEYGTPKQNAVPKNTRAILIDDNEEIIRQWNKRFTKAIKAENFIKELQNLTA